MAASMINNSENSSPDNNIHNEVALQNCSELSDKILEIRQIEYEQRLILEEIDSIDAKQQRLQDLLNLLQSTKSTGRNRNTKHPHRQFKSINSN